ncbi:hypothetical protein KILIM_019_00010, partial [Kineosphaera limosa NBRC 100340]
DAQIVPAVLGTRGELLDLGHAHRLAKPGLVTALELRDKTCTYPGCRIPAAWTDKHHLIHWANGGPTTEWNMACVCRHHHTVIHRHGHIGKVTPNGVEWTRADGTPIGNHPRHNDTSPTTTQWTTTAMTTATTAATPTTAAGTTTAATSTRAATVPATTTATAATTTAATTTTDGPSLLLGGEARTQAQPPELKTLNSARPTITTK